jgi:acetyl-CoA carboxylase carboxyltransferase component
MAIEPSLLEKLNDRKEEALLGGGQERIDKRHAKGQLTARERLDAFSTKVPTLNSVCTPTTRARTSGWKNARCPVTVSFVPRER